VKEAKNTYFGKEKNCDYQTLKKYDFIAVGEQEDLLLSEDDKKVKLSLGLIN
jgi:hypothetical protein